ncbi:MAG: hypothetical protein MAGBODY4_00718 [Candidatus Marinimicrobia bacterium]|nr:hypothetical protein [Candidatus Neomarinimicrobiota bacterium]
MGTLLRSKMAKDAWKNIVGIIINIFFSNSCPFASFGGSIAVVVFSVLCDLSGDSLFYFYFNTGLAKIYVRGNKQMKEAL